MKRRDKWILIVLIGCLTCGWAWVVYDVGYGTIWVIRDLKRMEAQRSVLLYETDHRALLEACREISRQVAAGKLEPGWYRIHHEPDPETRQFPQLILNLDPLQVVVEEDGQVNIIMSPVVMFGVCAFPKDYEGSSAKRFRVIPGDEVWGIELIDGLWYYDEDFLKHPEHRKHVEELLKKRKAADSSGGR